MKKPVNPTEEVKLVRGSHSAHTLEVDQSGENHSTCPREKITTQDESLIAPVQNQQIMDRRPRRTPVGTHQSWKAAQLTDRQRTKQGSLLNPSAKIDHPARVAQHVGTGPTNHGQPAAQGEGRNPPNTVGKKHRDKPRLHHWLLLVQTTLVSSRTN